LVNSIFLCIVIGNSLLLFVVMKLDS
jgi:hypothetical protein